MGPKLTVDSDYRHDIRSSLAGRTAMKNLDSALKRRDIILPTKVCIVKAMVFPVVMSREGNGNPVQYSLPGKSYGWSCLVAIVNGVEKSQRGLSDFHIHIWSSQWSHMVVRAGS